LLGINRIRIACALALPALGGELVHWRSDWELRVQLQTRVIPDALFEVRWDEAVTQSFALEIDHRTRSTRGFLRKLLGYMHGSVTPRASDASGTPILFVGFETNWAERYRQALARTRLA